MRFKILASETVVESYVNGGISYVNGGIKM